MFVLDLARTTKCAIRVVMNSAPYTYNLPELSRPRLLAGLVGLALAYAKASTSRAAATTCVNERLRQESDVNPMTGKPYSTELPDCRAYELVSSGDKNDDEAMLSPIATRTHSGYGNFGLVSENGALWDSEGESYSGPNNGFKNTYEAVRGSDGWLQSDALAPPGTGSTTEFSISAASSNLSTLLLEGEPPNPLEGGVSGSDQLIERTENGAYTPVASIPHGLADKPSAWLSGDGSHVFFQSPAKLAGDTHSGNRQLYEWTAGGGLHPVGVNDLGDPVSPCGATLAGGIGVTYPAVSRDGTRVFFQSPDPEQGKGGEPVCGQPSELYVRENGATTVEISKAPASAAECEPGVKECEAFFAGASEDGSDVFFVTRSQLTSNTGNIDPNLYEYNVETHTLKRISVGPPSYDDADLEGRTLAESVIVSSDGSHVYFTGRGQLVPGSGATKTTNESDSTVNLYMYDDGVISFIATIAGGVFPGNASGEGEHLETPGTPSSPLNIQVAAVTPNGSALVFDSDSQLTAYDNEHQAELYRYDAADNNISCISCSATFFAPPSGPLDPDFHTNFWSYQGGTVQQFGGLSADGETVFFASTDELLPAAANVLLDSKENPIYDIYEWHHGTLSLLSSGTSPASDFLIGASPSGANVYFLSGSQFVPEDSEHTYQIWDARTEGGFPASAPAQCESPETCRSMVATPPVTVTPATVNVSGTGNVTTVTGSEPPPPTIVKKSESRSEKLKKALKACRRDKAKAKRKSCERTARRKYGPKTKKKT
jgi:hypothetical protein